MPKRLTIKQCEFVKEFIKNRGNGTQAALDVYNVKNSNVAGAIASENLRKPKIQQAIRQALEAKGLTPESISEYLKQAIVSGLGNKATNSDALRGIDLYAKLTGAYQNISVEESYKVRLEKMNNRDLEMEIESVRKRTTQILEDTG